MSKGLEALEKIKYDDLCWNDDFYPSECDIVEKELKVLEIIKKKRVNVDALIKYIKTNAVDDIPLCWYNEYIALFEEDRCLTEEEYNLLKEVLL